MSPSLICRVGSQLCALPVENVVETMRPLAVAATVGMPPFVLGVSIIRGAVVPVVDAARLLGTEAPLRAGRFVTLRVGERRIALAVDAVEGVRVLASITVDELPPLLRDASADIIAAIGTLDGELLLVLRSASIVTETAWTGVAAAGTSP